MSRRHVTELPLRWWAMKPVGLSRRLHAARAAWRSTGVPMVSAGQPAQRSADSLTHRSTAMRATRLLPEIPPDFTQPNPRQQRDSRRVLYVLKRCHGSRWCSENSAQRVETNCRLRTPSTRAAHDRLQIAHSGRVAIPQPSDTDGFWAWAKSSRAGCQARFDDPGRILFAAFGSVAAATRHWIGGRT